MTETYNDFDVSIIGGICIDPRCLGAVRETGLTADDFKNTICASAYRIACDLEDAGKTIDPVILADSLKGELDSPGGFIKECMKICPTAANAPYHAKLLREEARNRRFHDAIYTAINEQDGEDLAGTLSGLSSDYLSHSAGGSLVPLSEAVQAVYTRISERDQRGRIDTGFPLLDGLMKGMWPGQLIVVGARPGVGKSAFAASIVANVARRGTPVLFCSLEMTADEIAERMIAAKSKIGLDTLIDGTNDPKVFRSIVPACTELSALPLTIHDRPGLTVAQIRARAKAIKGPGLVVVDYLGLMTSDRKRENRVLEIGDISRGLKLLACDLGVPIIALSQLNRGADETERPTLRSLRDSGEIEQDASKVILLWKQDPKNGKVAVSVAKNRRGASGDLVFYFDGSHMTFRETNETYKEQKPKNPVFDDD